MLGFGLNRRRSFKESLKQLEADIQHANTMALGLTKDGASLQMRLGFGPSFLLCFLSWVDYTLIGSVGLLHVLIYKVLKDGTTTMSIHERKASLREFYGYILPSLQVLNGGMTEKEVLNQKEKCKEKYKRNHGEEAGRHHSRAQIDDVERERECGICLEILNKVVLPGCSHSMCIKCYRDWRLRSASCPFCRKSLKRVNSKDLWIMMEHDDAKGAENFTRENHRRLLTYVEKLPLFVSDSPYGSKTKGYFPILGG